jgi:cyclin-dependent kinase 12/13
MVFDFMEHDMAGLLDRANRTQASRQQRRRADGLPPPPFTLGQVKRYMKQLFLGLALLHTNRILHRDLKNANLLVNNEGELKIADFGLARSVLQHRTSPESDGLRTDAQPASGQKAHTMTNRVITLWYRPPELCLGANLYGEEVDMWSAGCIMVEMLTGRPLFPGVDEVSQVELICKVLGRPTEESMPGCTKLDGYEWVRRMPKPSFPSSSQLRAKLEGMGVKDIGTVRLIEQLLSLDPSKRIKASEAAVVSLIFRYLRGCLLLSLRSL